MVRTRAQARSEQPTAPAPTGKSAKVKPDKQSAEAASAGSSSPTSTKRSLTRDTNNQDTNDRASVVAKKRKTVSPTPHESNRVPWKPRLDKLLAEHGSVPLADLGLENSEKATGETIVAHLFNALLSSARIGHDIAHKTLQCLIKNNYQNLEALKKSTWEQRTEVLTEGGYTRYREKTATYLGDLASLIEETYDGNPIKLLSGSRKNIEQRLKEIKGLGPLGVDIFFETVQTVEPSVAPYMGKRNVSAAKEMGLGNVEQMWEAVGKDCMEMGKLCTALTTERLTGK